MIVERNERVKGKQLHLAGKALVVKGQFGQRVLALKIDALKMGQTSHIFTAWAKAK